MAVRPRRPKPARTRGRSAPKRTEYVIELRNGVARIDKAFMRHARRDTVRWVSAEIGTPRVYVLHFHSGSPFGKEDVIVVGKGATTKARRLDRSCAMPPPDLAEPPYEARVFHYSVHAFPPPERKPRRKGPGRPTDPSIVVDG